MCMSGLALAIPSKVSWPWLPEPMSPTAAKVSVSATGETDGAGKADAGADVGGPEVVVPVVFALMVGGVSSCRATAAANEPATMRMQTRTTTLRRPMRGEDTAPPPARDCGHAHADLRSARDRVSHLRFQP